MINEKNELEELTSRVFENIRKLLDEREKEEILNIFGNILDLEQQILVLRIEKE
ncbi:hypothetical protein NNC19_15325 [Clostridium sp. SHJSY1]|uniref:hypothetical protein n=1 Tax=Clostridium sp. SHJSY1 TaxID=2942483 RepID=UPI0028755842|nr:hypothetical protein [Clostridium sp. SHJSY1]MDS0527064.1 hypothetical protein [Clostridium sp. SHJSY1]